MICLAMSFVCLWMTGTAQEKLSPPTSHPDVSSWEDLFDTDLSNAIYPEEIWTFEDGILTASEDQAIWSQKSYDNFIIDLEFKTASGTNSGVIVYTSDIDNWIPNSVEIQIADDYHEKWAKSRYLALRSRFRPSCSGKEFGQKSRRMEPLHHNLYR